MAAKTPTPIHPFALLSLLHFLLFLLLHDPTAALAVSTLCSSDYGHPSLPDCRAAIDRLPYSSTPIFFGPAASRAGTITCPFSVPSVSATDPLWIEIAQTGVQGPSGSGGTAPLLKGVTADQLAQAGLSVSAPKPVLRYWADGGVGGEDGFKGGAGRAS